jgi:hypothetical protein
MRVMLFTDYATMHGRPKRAGDVAELPETVATGLIAAGQAAAYAGEIETTTRQRPVERAVRPGGRARR